MVVAVFIRQLSPGGAEKQSLLLTREMQKQFPVFLVVWTKKIVAPEYRKVIEDNNLSVLFLGGSPIAKFIKFLMVMKQERVTHLFNFLLINNMVGGFAGRIAGVRHIFGGVRNCEIVPSKLGWQKFLHNYISHKTIFNNYSGTENLTLRGFRKDKMLVIHNGIDVNGVLPAKSKSSVPVILTASRFWPQKDHYTALKAIKELAGQGKKFSYVLAGYGAQEGEIRQWITDLGLDKFVHLLISPANLAALFNQASVYLSTSVREGLSNSIMEAMAAALPVVATNVGDNKYLINDGENGFLTDVGDYKKLSECLSDLLDNEQRRFKMGKSGYEKLVTRFSSRHFLDSYLALVKESVNT